MWNKNKHNEYETIMFVLVHNDSNDKEALYINNNLYKESIKIVTEDIMNALKTIILVNKNNLRFDYKFINTNLDNFPNQLNEIKIKEKII